MPVYYVGFFNSTFVNLWGVDVTYWPPDQIGLLIRSFTNRVKSFLLSICPFALKPECWTLVSAAYCPVHPQRDTRLFWFDLLGYLKFVLLRLPPPSEKKYDEYNLFCVTLSCGIILHSLAETDISLSVEMKAENFLSVIKLTVQLAQAKYLLCCFQLRLVLILADTGQAAGLTFRD